MKVNGGSPVGPGFVVYERAPGLVGYDLDLAKASVGAGWHPLLELIFRLLDMPQHARRPQPYVIQVKEKLGGLRVYLENAGEYESGYVSGLESASFLICEECGERGTLRTDRTWHRTLCENHSMVDLARIARR